MRNWVITCDNHEPCLRESDVIFHIEKIYYHDRKREHLILYRGRAEYICGLDVTTEAYPYIAGLGESGCRDSGAARDDCERCNMAQGCAAIAAIAAIWCTVVLQYCAWDDSRRA
jgi:hypothetical protein